MSKQEYTENPRWTKGLADTLGVGPRQRIAALAASGCTVRQIVADTGFCSSYVGKVLRLSCVKAERERLFLIWFHDLMQRQVGDIPPHPGVE